MKSLRHKVADAGGQTLAATAYMAVQGGLLAYMWWHNWDPPDSPDAKGRRPVPAPGPDPDYRGFWECGVDLDPHTKAQRIYDVAEEAGCPDSVSYLLGELIVAHRNPTGDYFTPEDIAILSEGRLSEATVRRLQLHCPEHPRPGLSYEDLIALCEVFDVGLYLWIDTDLLRRFVDSMDDVDWSRAVRTNRPASET